MNVSRKGNFSYGVFIINKPEDIVNTKPTLTDVLDSNPALVRNQIVFDESLRVCEEDFRAHHGGVPADTHESLLLRILTALRHPHSPSHMLHMHHPADKKHPA